MAIANAQTAAETMARVDPDLRPSLDAYATLLRSRFGQRLVMLRLFGSQARGDAGPHSDADVAVIVRDLTDHERAEAVDLALEARRNAGRRGAFLAPLVWSEEEWVDSVRATMRGPKPPWGTTRSRPRSTCSQPGFRTTR